ncbi:hypothetical protein VTN96DRAFT_705 [Rasamsonia emersonii]
MSASPLARRRTQKVPQSVQTSFQWPRNKANGWHQLKPLFGSVAARGCKARQRSAKSEGCGFQFFSTGASQRLFQQSRGRSQSRAGKIRRE